MCAVSSDMADQLLFYLLSRRVASELCVVWGKSACGASMRTQVKGWAWLRGWSRRITVGPGSQSNRKIGVCQRSKSEENSGDHLRSSIAPTFVSSCICTHIQTHKPFEKCKYLEIPKYVLGLKL